MINNLVNNWKVEELIKERFIEIIPIASQDYDLQIIREFNLPLARYSNVDNSQTSIEWKKMKNYYSFCTDDFKEEIIVENFKKSSISSYDILIMTFGWNETVAKIPTNLFIEDPLEYFFSKAWDGFIFSNDFKLILETSHDYYVHSNFKIMIE